MKIVSFHAENFMKLRAVQITPDGNMVQITGGNGEGKSSILNAIWAAVGGKDHAPTQPIRRGEKSAKIRLDLGEIIVTRTFSESGGTTLTVEAQNGARFPSPQRMLNDLIGAISFDPIAFATMDPKQQFAMLRSVVKIDVDLDALAGANTRDYEKRTEVNRDAKALRAQTDAIVVPADLPADPIDVHGLMDAMAKAAETNSDIERRKGARERAVEKIAEGRIRADNIDAGLAGHLLRVDREAAEKLSDIDRQIADLQKKRVSVETWSLNEAAAAKDEAVREAAEARAEADALQAKLDAAPALPAAVDVDSLRAQIDNGTRVNRDITARTRRAELASDAAKKEAEAERLTAAMAERDKQRREAIEGAEMPVAGLSLGDGQVLYNELPLTQASHAERLRVSVAIAMAANPKLRVLRVENGESMDAKSLAILQEMLDLADFQCWLEVVSDGERPGILIEDGAVKQRTLV